MTAGDSLSLISGFLLFCLFALGAWALNRMIGKYGKVFQKGRYMKVVDQIQIAQDRQLFILRLEKENRCLLLGSGTEGVRLICELKEDYEEEGRIGKPSGGGLSDLWKNHDFSAVFRKKSLENREEETVVTERGPDE